MTRTRSLADRARDPSLSGDTSPELGGNLDVSGNHIVSTSNGNIAITPHGSGQVVLDGLSWPTSDGSSNQLLKTDGSGSLSFATVNSDVVSDTTPQLGGSLDVNGNAIVSVSNGNISITPNGSGKVILDGLSHPTSDGSSGQFLKTDGSGSLSFDTVNTDLSGDSTPQLGGNLDVNGNSIVSASNGNIAITPNGSGKIILDGISFPTADGSADTVLKTDGSGNLAFSSVSALSGSGIQQVQDDTSPVLGGTLNANSNQITNVTTIGGAKGVFTSSATGQLTLNSTSSDYMLEFQRSGTSEWWLKASSSSFAIHENGGADYLTIASGGNATFAGALSVNTSSTLSSVGQIGIYRGSSPFISFHDGTTSRTAYFQESSGRFYFGEVSYTESVGSFRAPIFYDTDNTAKYLNPNGTSKINVLEIDGGTSNAPNDATLYVSATNNNDWGIWLDKYRSSATEYGMRIDVGSSANYAFFVRGNDVEKFRIAGNGTFYGSIFYDNGNTGYYVDPAGDSSLYRLTTTDRIQGSTYIEALTYLSSPIMYDYNNTGYYSDPSSNSNVYRITAADRVTSANYMQAPIYYDHNNSAYYTDPASWSTLYDVNIIRNLSLAGSNGTAGQVLQTNGANQSPTWVDAGGGAWEVVGNYTGTGVTSLDFVHGSNNIVFNSTTYKHMIMYAMLWNNNVNYQNLAMYPLVGSTSSYAPMSNLVYFHEHRKEMYPEFSGVSYGSWQWGKDAQYGANNQGKIASNIRLERTTSSGDGMATFNESIGGTTYYSNNRFYPTQVKLDFQTKGFSTDFGLNGQCDVWYDDPSIYAYKRYYTWQMFNRGYGKVGFRIVTETSGATWNYDITWIGLKP